MTIDNPDDSRRINIGLYLALGSVLMLIGGIMLMAEDPKKRTVIIPSIIFIALGSTINVASTGIFAAQLLCKSTLYADAIANQTAVNETNTQSIPSTHPF